MYHRMICLRTYDEHESCQTISCPKHNEHGSVRYLISSTAVYAVETVSGEKRALALFFWG